MSKYGVASGPYFPAYGLNTGKYGPEITQYLDTFHVVLPRENFFCSVENNSELLDHEKLMEDVCSTDITNCRFLWNGYGSWLNNTVYEPLCKGNLSYLAYYLP